MKKLNGHNARKKKASKAFECAGRWLVKQNKACTASNIYENMTYKNGNLYRTQRGTMNFHSFVGKICRQEPFKMYREKPTGPYLFTCSKEQYDKRFGDDYE